jgi:regulatory protein YycI of two-component signal transduction system YycFG
MFYKTEEDYLTDLELATGYFFPKNSKQEFDKENEYFEVIKKGAEALILKSFLENIPYLKNTEKMICSYFVLSGAVMTYKEISLQYLTKIIGLKSIMTTHKAINNMLEDYTIIKNEETSKFNCYSYCVSFFQEYVNVLAKRGEPLKYIDF